MTDNNIKHLIQKTFLAFMTFEVNNRVVQKRLFSYLERRFQNPETKIPNSKF